MSIYGYVVFLKCPGCNKKYHVFWYDLQRVIYFYGIDTRLRCPKCLKDLECVCAGKIVSSNGERTI